MNDSRLIRNGKTILAYDHEYEHDPLTFESVCKRLDPTTVFEMDTHNLVTKLSGENRLIADNNVWQHEGPHSGRSRDGHVRRGYSRQGTQPLTQR